MNQIYCANCGNLIPINSNFCKICGAPQHGSEAGAYRAEAPLADSPAQAQKEALENKGYKPDFFENQHLGPDAILHFFFTYIRKTLLALILIIIGAALLQGWFILALPIYLVSILIGTFLTYNNFTFEINSKGLVIKSGVIHRSEVSLPYDQVQNVNIERTLFDRILGLSKLSIETAGSAQGNISNGTTNAGGKIKAEAYLPGLHLDIAKKIHDLLIDGSDGIFGN